MDKSGAPVGEREKTRPIQAIQNRRKKPLASAAGLCKMGLSHRSYRASVSRRPASAGFLFARSLEFLQTVVNTKEPDPESDRPSQSLPEYLSHGKCDATCECFVRIIQLHALKSYAGR